MDKKWNLQDIRPAGGERRRRPAPKPREAAPAAEEPQESRAPARKKTREPKNRKPILIALMVAVVILLPGFVIGYVLDGADITVHPRSHTPVINGTFEAAREAGAGELSYEVMTLEAEGERRVQATGEEEVSEQATGFIEIMNTRESSERLIKNTRFESPQGLIYRITESVVVPAATGDTPGTVRAEVFADEPGEEYNIGPATFTVPGYKEGGYTELFEAITARSTASMQGGYEGLSYIIGEEELASAQKSLYSELEEALRARVPEERPAGFILFDDAITFSYKSLPSTEAGDDLVTIKEQVSLHVPLFAEGEFAAHLADAGIPGYEDHAVRLEDADALTFAYTSATTTTSVDLRALDSITFSLEGTPRIVWTYDADQLKQDLVGAAKGALPNVLSGYPAIERAEAVIRPFWKRSFPKSADEIDIIEIVG
ncbi:MAG: hypothetical protein WDZ93_03370 [Candidatus Paceibacterota bacterium]